MLNVSTTGIKELDRYLVKTSKKLDNMVPVLRPLGLVLISEYQQNMTRGIDPTGRKLKPVARWTRTAGRGRGTKTRGNLTPLVNTGRMRNSMSIQSLSKSSLEIGWKGQQKTIAEKMRDGTPGRMKLRQKRIKRAYTGVRTAKDGHKYIAVKNGHQWITRQVQGDSVLVNPQKRDFFFLSDKQGRMVLSGITRFVEKTVNDN